MSEKRGESDLIRQSGTVFIRELLSDGLQPDIPPQLREDRLTIADWLGYNVGELTTPQSQKLEKAWNAYLAIGLAPSMELQTAFDHYGRTIQDVDKADRAPPEVMRVFDRLLATDEQIKIKRSADLQNLETRFRPHFDKLRPKAKGSWWRRQPPIVRNWVFASAVWVALVAIYAYFFDPFDVGGWDRLTSLSSYSDELGQLYLIMLVPVGAGAVTYAYRRWVR